MQAKGPVAHPHIEARNVDMKKLIIGTTIALLTGIALVGCAQKATLCGACGQMKGSTGCCDANAANCSGCGLDKGSPGCCKMTKGTDANLCTGCGQIKGSDSCCQDGAAKCSGCGLDKGSPGCCKI